jgi:hypothetical protein
MARSAQAIVRAGVASPEWRGSAVGNFDATDFEENFGRFLTEERLFDPAASDRAARKTGERLDRVLTKLGLAPEANLGVSPSRSGFLGGRAFTIHTEF